VTKSEFVDQVADRAGLSKKDAGDAVDAVLETIEDLGRRRLVESVLDRYDSNVAPRWPRLRAHVVHGDLNLDNVLFDDTDRISALVDFGDVGHTAQVGDFAIGLASLIRGRPLDDVFRVARIAIDDIALRRPTLDDVFLTLTGHATEVAPPAANEKMPAESRKS